MPKYSQMFHFQTTNIRIVKLHQRLKLTFILGFFAEKWVRTGGNGRSQRCRRWLHQSRFTQSRGKRWKRSQWKKEKESMFELQEKSRLDRYEKKIIVRRFHTSFFKIPNIKLEIFHILVSIQKLYVPRQFLCKKQG